MEINGIFGLIILLLAIFAILKIAQSPESTGIKALWILLVLVLPLLGLVIWYFAGPGDKSFKLSRLTLRCGDRICRPGF